MKPKPPPPRSRRTPIVETATVARVRPDRELVIALLRGINLGGKNPLPMAALVELCTEIGCTDVRTYIQSGNVLFRPPARGRATIDRRLAAAIAERFALEVPVVLRRADELDAVLDDNPFVARGVDPEQLHVAFLRDVPDEARIATLDPRRSPGDAFVVVGRDVHLWLPNGVARSKLTNAYLDARLATVSTIRNLRTVAKLRALARA